MGVGEETKILTIFSDIFSHFMVGGNIKCPVKSGKYTNVIVTYCMFVKFCLPHSHKSEKKPFHRIEGEWNGVMYTKHSNDVSTLHTMQ